MASFASVASRQPLAGASSLTSSRGASPSDELPRGLRFPIQSFTESHGCLRASKSPLQSSHSSPRKATSLRATTEETTSLEGESSKPISLGTAELPLDIDLARLEILLFQWATNLTQNANLPLSTPLKVDKIDSGVRLSYINVVNGQVEVLVTIDVTVKPAAEGESRPMFRAVRDGPLKNVVPPQEPAIMQGLLSALRKSVPLCRNS